jgi:hypothetical protein
VEAPEQLRITWAQGSEFLAAYDRAAGRYTVAVPHSSRVLRRTSIGERLLVEHQFADSQKSFRGVARVIEHRAGPPEIVTLEFVDGRNAALVVCHAEGQSVPYLNRRVARHPVWMPVEVGPRALHGIITELSELGAFITSNHPTPDGTITLRLPAAGARLEIKARVLYTRDVHEPGFAVEFVFANREEEVQLQAAIGRALQANQRK